MPNSSAKPFEILAIPRKDLPQHGCRYRVYSSASESMIVSASTALEALAASGLGRAYKIAREDLMSLAILDRGLWQDIDPAIAAAAAAADAAAIQSGAAESSSLTPEA